MEVLTASQIRVLGSLIEKALTTPAYYPLTLNSLIAACNQKSNRNPVIEYDEKTVARALVTLRERSLVNRIMSDDARVPKYKHNFPAAFNLNPAQLAIMDVLMLRGQQTVGEIRARSKRLFDFRDLAEVEATLEELAGRREEPLVVELPRQVGMKDSRWAHLLAGEPEIEPAPASSYVPLEAASIAVAEENKRISKLENEVQELRAEIEDLRREFSDFRTQFE